jgi:transcriptional regulator with XRE-family HTH domain
VPEVSSPTVRRRELGAILRRLRTEKNFTVEQAAAEVMFSPSKLSRIETGQGIAKARDVRDLCNLYGVTDEAEREHLMDLAAESKEQGWWEEYDLPYKRYIGLEAAATSIKVYDSAVVPGLLQTADYARTLLEVAVPRQDDYTIGQSVKARETRQEILRRQNPPQFHAVLDEAVLRRPVGGPQVMRPQLARVAEAAQMPNVTIQVIPYEIGAHPGLDSVFTLLEFSGEAPDVVYVEGLIGPTYVDRSEDIERYIEAFDQLSDVAFDPQRSVEFIRSAAEAVGSVRPLAGEV